MVTDPNSFQGSDIDDIYEGTTGDDFVWTYAGDDDVNARGGDDWVKTGSGDDTVRGGGDDDSLIGGAGNDRLLGNEGDDRLIGGDGNDVLLGGDGDDRMIGGDGDDRLLGGSGRDFMRGGAGADQFVFNDDSTGRTVVADFEFGVDRISLSGVSVDEIREVSAGALMRLSNGGEVLFRGASVEDIREASHQPEFQIVDDTPTEGETLPIYVLAGQSNASELFVSNVVTELEDNLSEDFEAFGIAHFAVPGTSLGVIGENRPDWNPGSEDNLYDQLVAFLAEAELEARAAGYVPEIEGLFWLQGEADATDPGRADAYDENLTAFIEALREDVDAELAVVLGEVRTTSTPYDFADTVRENQQAVADALEDVVLVDSDGLPLQDSVHYAEEGMEILMEEMVDAMIGIQDDIV